MTDFDDDDEAEAVAVLKRGRTKKHATPERDLQRLIVSYVRRCCPHVILAATVNEQAGTGTVQQRMRFGQMRKLSGVLSGAPDLTLFLPGGRVLLVELKAPKGVMSDAQKDLHPRLAALGHVVCIVRSLEEMKEALVRSGVSPRTPFQISLGPPNAD